MGEVTVGIDIGTTSVKAVAAGADGEVVARCRIPHALLAATPDRFEHDAAAAWSAGVLAAWEQVGPAAGNDVAGVCVAAMVPSMCGVDAAGRPRTPGLLYGDARGEGDVEGEAVGFARWLGANVDRSVVAGLWPAQAVANHALCGVGAIDTTTAMAMLPLFAGTGWDESVCAAIGVEPGLLPALSPGTAAIGSVTGTDIPVNGGTVDVLAEQLVADAREPGDVLVLCGTTLIPWVLTEGWPEVEGLWTVPFTVPGITAVGGASNAGGLFVDAVRSLLGGEVAPGEVAAGDVPVWLPYLRGERTPLHDRSRRAELLGFALGHGPAAVLRAAHEAAGFVVRHHVELAGVAPRRIVAVGGGTRSPEWMQALADTTGLPVDVAAVPEGAALGAAYLARVTAGLEADTTGSGRWARVGGRVEPRPAWVEACGSRYARFLAATRRPGSA